MDVVLQNLQEVFVLKIRIKFSKYGALKFIGHLDVMRYFQKVMRRAEIDIAYSEGYSPHQIMSFASPLGVGLCSNGEYLDIEVHSVTSSKQMMEDMNRASVDGITIVGVWKLPEEAQNAMSSVKGADYTVSFREGQEPACDLKGIITEFLSQQEISVVKETKKSTRELDIKPFIHQMELQEDGSVFMRLTAGSADNIKPELVMDALTQFANVPLSEFALMITREDLYGENFVPLSAAGELF